MLYTGGVPGIGTLFLLLYAPISTSHFASIWIGPKRVLLYIIGCFERVERFNRALSERRLGNDSVAQRSMSQRSEYFNSDLSEWKGAYVLLHIVQCLK